MKKITLKLFDVHSSFKVKFTSFLASVPFPPNGVTEDREVVQKYMFAGNTYITINPTSFVVIDISTKQDKGENYSSNTSFSMDRRKLFTFILRLEKLYRAFTQEKDLFSFNSNNELVVNHQLADKYEQTLEVNGQKMLKMRHCVTTYDNDERTYEGIYIAVNALNYYSYLTYDQIEFLTYELRKINFSAMELDLIVTALEYEKAKTIEIKPKPLVSKVEEKEIVDTKKKVFIEEASVIPEL